MISGKIKSGLDWLTNGEDLRMQLEIKASGGKADQVIFLDSRNAIEAIALALLKDEFAEGHDSDDLFITETLITSIEDESPCVFSLTVTAERLEESNVGEWVRVDFKPRRDQMNPSEILGMYAVS